MKVGTIGLLAVGILLTLPVLQNQAVTKFASSGKGPVFAGPLFPFVFIIIACGALSGFHALIASGTTPKLIEKESQVRMIGYGAMLTESFVAVMAMVAASILDQGLYFAMNAPAGVVGTTVQSASAAVTKLGFTIGPEQLQAAAQSVQEHTLIARVGGAPTLAVGMSTIFSGAFGGEALKAFWYHFAIMFEALFILTTVDAGTRVGRFMLQDTLGNLWKPIGRPSWRPGVYATSAAVVLAWGYFLWVGATDPLGGINQLFPLFGIANQLLAAVALTVATTILIKSGRLRWAWVTAVPLAWDAAVTLSASWYKIFSSDPLIGFFAQRAKFQQALDAGKVIPPAKSLDDVGQIVTNSTVDGILSILFAALIVVVILDAARVWFQTLSGRREPVLAETPAEPSRLWAPSGLFPTAEDRARQAEMRRAEPVGAARGRDGGDR
jgi:carbon starvation protein